MNIRYVVKAVVPRSLFAKIEPTGHKLEAMLFAAKNGFPARKLRVIGVTGTDGKTTTCMLIAQMLRQSGYKVAVLTTISVDLADGKGQRPSPAHLTTASASSLFAMLKTVARNKPDWVVLETSSHALAQNRGWGIPYEVAVMTNVTHEHLDYHKTFARYVAAKVRLFQQCTANKRGLQVGVINADDPSAEQFVHASANPVTYGQKNGDVRATHIKLTSAGSRFRVELPDETYQIACHIPGGFNVSNSLAAVCVGRAVGLDRQQIEQGIASLISVPGRMERIDAGQPFEVVIDYAVTPEALKNVLQTVQATTSGAVHLVFGATGDRDKEKRPVMGGIAAKYADYIYLTDDETHTEDPDQIRQAVYAGIQEAGGADRTTVIDDRLEAIKRALDQAQPGDAVLITGMGHQTTRNMGGVDQPWDDRVIAAECLNADIR